MRKRKKVGTNPITVLKSIRESYSGEKEGHRYRLIVLMVSAFTAFQKLKADTTRVASFYKEAGTKVSGRSKPVNLLKEVMAYIAGANSDSGKKLAWKRARVLEYLDDKGIPAEKMAAKITKYGGIEKTYKIAARKTPRREEATGLVPVKKSKVGELRSDSDDDEETSITEDTTGNDRWVQIVGTIRLSNLDKLQKEPDGTKLKLVVRRIDEDDVSFRVIGVGASYHEW
ncbi:hypothetical protein JQ615_09610 [Bradyrhizobium jicamae]|uniref:Uncharacterized protein n=1 Tax=Bradyrhizobium jicamae TaxID=280332 RepID=A0ABS5FFU2_9BRAD|nr:hypothetical protein [Bradyrhizobium jicamae]MBR0795643.1 hypothetical protein [Bradyrhizobium jicamae]